MRLILLLLCLMLWPIVGLVGPKSALAAAPPPSGVVREFADTNYYWYENKNLKTAALIKIWSLVVGYAGVGLILAYQLGNAAEILLLPRREINFIYLAKAD